MFKFRSTERIESLERAVEELQKDPAKVRREWENHLHKLGQIMHRLNARARQEALKGPESDEPHPDPAKPTSSQPGVSEHALLSEMRRRTFGGKR